MAHPSLDFASAARIHGGQGTGPYCPVGDDGGHEMGAGLTVTGGLREVSARLDSAAALGRAAGCHELRRRHVDVEGQLLVHRGADVALGARQLEEAPHAGESAQAHEGHPSATASTRLTAAA